jgi:regulator of RNase E activity RraA
MDDVVSALAGFDTSALSDAMDRLRIAGQAEGIFPLSESFRLAGRAFTGLYQPVDDSGGTVGDYIDDVPPGAVIVLDNAKRTDATVWGDILTMVATHRRVSGTVIDGVCRDSRRSRELSYPVFSRGRWMRTGKDRVRLAGVEVPVTIGGVRVNPGDVLVGDGDGVVVIPRDREQQVLDTVRDIEAAEESIREAFRAGASLVQARSQFGYHQLQTHG